MRAPLATSLAATALAVLLAVSGCGTTRPTAAEISQTLRSGVSTDGGSKVKLTEEQAECAAKVFLASGLSDEALRAIADSQSDYKSSKADDEALDEVRPELAKCATS